MQSTTHALESILVTAVEMSSEAERRRFVDQACAGDAELKRRVEALIDNHFRAGTFLECPATDLVATLGGPAVSERPGTVIGPYRLLEQIGEGGFGIVFRAEQQQPVRRQVALKVLKPGMDTRQVVARFEAERQALALMDHPNIAHVFDGGETDSGRPFFVMELVKGTPITKYCDEHRLTPRQRLELFVPVCQALQHAHQKGVIHRDIKPSNVLVATYDGRPVVKVIDFGVAKATGQRLTERTLFTGLGAMVGTLESMSPEQAELNNQDIDTRSDIYSMGVLLYELLTGTTPLGRKRAQEAGLVEALRVIREEETPRPSARLSLLEQLPGIAASRGLEPRKLSGLVRGELDWIAMKALEKDRNRRYPTANDLAQDVARYLRNEPVLACPPSAAYRFRKFARRNKGTLLTLTLAGGVLAATAVLLVTLRDNAKLQEAINEAATARDREAVARQAEADAHKQLESQSYYHRVALASLEWRDKHLARADQLLDGCPGYLRHWEWHYLQRVSHPERLRLTEHGAPLTGVAYSPDGKYLASADELGAVVLRDAASGRTLHSFQAHPGAVRELTFSPDSRRLAFTAGAHIKLWDIGGRRESASLAGHQQPVVGLAFSRDGKLLASASADQVIKVWDATVEKGPPPWKASASWEVPLDKKVRHGPAHVSLVFSPDGQRLASVHPPDRRVRLWEAATGRRLLMTARTGETLSLAYSPDGRLLAGGGSDGRVQLWGLAPGPLFGVAVHVLRGHGGPVTAVAFSPDGRRLASGSSDQTIKVWDPTPNPEGIRADGAELWTLKGHTAGVVGLAYTPDGKRLASADLSGKLRVWDADLNPEVLALTGHKQLRAMAFGADGKEFLTVDSDQTVKVWHTPTGGALRTVPLGEKVGVRSAFSPDGRLFAGAVAGAPGSFPVKVWDTTTGAERQVLRGHTKGVFSVTFSPDSRRLATAGHDLTVRVWEVGTGRQIHLLAGHTKAVSSLAFSPDGTRLASGGIDKSVKLWDLTTGLELRALRGHTGRIWGLSFGPGGQRLASASGDGTVKVWEVASGRALLNLPGHLNAGARGAAFSPDGKRLITVGFDHTIKVWDPTSGENPLSLRGETAVEPEAARVWDAAATPDTELPVLFPIRSIEARVWDAAATPDTVQICDAIPLRIPEENVGVVFSPDDWRFAAAETLGVVFSPDGWRFATATPDTVQIWDATPRGNGPGVENQGRTPMSPQSSENKKPRDWPLTTKQCGR
jgi:WD40 repeat protein/serine/threonine protein kinase